MAETSDAIKQHIEARRAALAQDVNELEYRVKRAADWRAHFDRHPAVALGAAFGVGLALAFATASKAYRH
jgi:hypothetical protein